MRSAFFTLLFALVGCSLAQGQEIQDLRKKYPSSYPLYSNIDSCQQFEKPNRKGVINPLSPSAFNKFIIDKYSYTILGSLTPATGLKFETTNPSISLKGNIYSNNYKTIITSVELTGGVKDGLMEIFSQNKLNSYFKATINLNLLLSRNWAKFNGELNNYYTLCYLRTKAAQKYDNLLRARDTMYVLEALTNKDMVETTAKLDMVSNYYARKTNTTPNAEKIKSLKDIASYYLEIFSPDKVTLDTDDKLSKALEFYARQWKLPKDCVEEKDALFKSHKKFAAMAGKFVDSLHTYEINAVKDIWTMNHIKWVTISPVISHNNFALYDAVTNTIEQRSSFLYGGKAALNLFWKYKQPHRYTYLTLGVSAQKVNTQTEDEMTKFTYKKTEQIKIPDPSNPNTSESITKEETGTAYRGTFSDGFGYDVFSDFYYVPWKNSFIPGFYNQIKFSHGNPWITKNKLSTSLGLVFNVTSSDKDAKNLLTIVPYARWSNILKVQKDPILGINEPLHDRFSVGVMVGIPINIGK